MPLRFNCEQCDVKIKVPDGSEGKKVKCPSCGHAQRVQVEAPAAARALPTRPVVATSATPPKAMERGPSEPSRARRTEERPAAATVEEEAEVDEDALSALASAVSGPEAQREPEARPVPPAARLPRAPRESRQQGKAGRGQARRGQADVATEAKENGEPTIGAGAPSASPAGPAPAAMPMAAAPVAPASRDEADAEVDDGEWSTVAEGPVQPPIEGSTRMLAERTAEEDAALAAFLSAPDPRSHGGSINENVAGDAEPVVVARAPFVVWPAPEESAFSSSASLAPPADEARDSEPSESLPPAATTIGMNDRPAVPKSTALALPGGGEDVGEAGDSSTGAVVVTQAPSMSESPSEAGEAPAGEVRDLFDDFVRREERERQIELAKEKKRRATEARKEVKPTDEPPVQPAPVVVVKSVPAPIRRGVTKHPEAVESGAPPAAASTPVAAAGGVPVSSSQPLALSSAPVAVAPAAAPRAPQAIPLASPGVAPAGAPAPSMKLAGDAVASADDEGDVNPIARLSSALASAPPAPSQHLEPPPPYALLLVLCWMLRMLACLSVVSVTKLLLLWSDAGASAFEVIIVLPLGLGVAAAIWGVGEVARVTRDAARGGPHR